MNVRELQLLPHPPPQQIPIHADAIGVNSNIDLIHAPARTLTPLSVSEMNSLNGSHTPPPPQSTFPKSTLNGTIRSVPSDSLHLEYPPSDENSPRNSSGDPPAMPHSTRSSPQPSMPQSQPALSRYNPNANLAVGNGPARKISSEFRPTKPYSNTNLQVQEEASRNGDSGGQWSSAVGRAQTGKSGRVIERLMGENDMLKRDLNIERLRAEESKQAVRMAEGKMEALAAEYDGKLHDAAINKTLLKRRERQVAEMKSQIETEKNRADKAVERELGWKEAMDKIEEESKQKVEEAQTFAALMKGRNDAMTGHWRDQGLELNKTVEMLAVEIDHLVRERRSDDVRMNKLQGLCDQQEKQLLVLEEKKAVIEQAFEKYKQAQEDSLRDIKDRARAQEKANEAALQETQRVLGELKWALGVKHNVKGVR